MLLALLTCIPRVTPRSEQPALRTRKASREPGVISGEHLCGASNAEAAHFAPGRSASGMTGQRDYGSTRPQRDARAGCPNK
jgi:hypothetical protein